MIDNELKSIRDFRKKLQFTLLKLEGLNKEELLLHLEEMEISIKCGNDTLESTQMYFKGILYGLQISNMLDSTDRYELMDLLIEKK